MNLHPKTVRRVGLLLLVVVVVSLGLTGAWAMRQRQRDARELAARAEGMAAYEKGDYPAALTALSGYVGKHRDDFEAMLAYGQSRAKVEEQDYRHLREGIEIFRVLQHMRPDDLTVRHDLLDLYVRAGYASEAIELADVILERQADDVKALKAKALALEMNNRYSEAVVVLERINQLKPDDIEAQIDTYRLYRRTQKPAPEALARAQKMAEAHSDDPRFTLLLAVAQEYAGDSSRSHDLLKQAASGAVSDPVFVRQMSSLLDAAGLFIESQQLLERAARESDSPDVLRLLARRLWQNDRYDALVERLNDVPTDTGDAELLALRAMAHHARGETDQASAIAGALANRNEGSAIAWTSVLKTQLADPALAPKQAVENLLAAMKREPGMAIIRQMLGDAYERMHEVEPAIEAWRQAAELAPSWALPYVRIARAAAATGRYDDAVAAAARAHRAAPTALAPAVTLAVTSWLHLNQHPNPAHEAALLRDLTSIQRVRPNEPETLPMYVSLLARAGQRDQAIATITAALPDASLDPVVLPRLSSVSRTHQLGLQDEILQALNGKSAASPALALAHAAELAAEGRNVEGLALMRSAGEAAPATDKLRWDLAMAQYLEMIADTSAAQAWIALGDGHPQDLQVQTTVLKLADTARADREFWARTIERVRALTREDALLWRVEHARWLLGSPMQRDHSAAVNTLTDIVRATPSLVEPRILLAAALEKVGNVGGASREMESAAELRSKDETVLLELARLQQLEGRFVDARKSLDRLARLDEVRAETRRRVALMLAQQGERERAIAFLEESAQRQPLDPACELLLAELLHRHGQFDKARAIYDHLLAQPVIEPGAIASAASFQASRGDLDLAKKTLARLNAAQLRPGVRELLEGEFAEQHGAPADAEAKYLAATTIAPTDPATWRALAQFQLRQERPTDAMATIQAGLKNVPGDKRLTELQQFAQLASAGDGSSAEAFKLLMESMSAEGGSPEAVALVQALQEASAAKLTPEQTAEKLRGLADRYPRFRPLQQELIRRSLEAGRLNDAVELAIRAMAAFPNDASIAALATDVLRLAEQWKQMEVGARQWRDRSLNDPARADFAIAEARLRQKDPAGAMRQIAPHLERVNRQPQADPALTIVAARVLAATGQPTQARNLLEPQVTVAPVWRKAWVNVASDEITTATEAVAWLRHIESITPADNADERFDLAIHYREVGVRLNDQTALADAKRLLVPLTKDARHGTSAALLLGEVAGALGDMETAIASYRQALQANPDHPNALNNLGYMLMVGDGDLGEAERLVRRAIERAPKVSAFHDTLGRIQLKQGQPDTALTSFRTALVLDPVNLEALVGQALALSKLERHSDVAAVLRQIDGLLSTGMPVPATLQEEITALRSRPTAAADTR